MNLPRVVDFTTGAWQEHARFPGIYMKGLLTTEDNPLANVNVVQIPPSCNIGRHRHVHQLETVWVITGKAILVIDQMDVSISIGQIVAIPIGLEHALRNESQALVELLTFFTPPLT